MNIGPRIKELRTKKGLSQDQLADLINERSNLKLKRGSISEYENGKITPRLEVVEILLNFFEVTADYLFQSENTERDKERLDKFQKYKASEDEFVKMKSVRIKEIEKELVDIEFNDKAIQEKISELISMNRELVDKVMKLSKKNQDAIDYIIKRKS